MAISKRKRQARNSFVAHFAGDISIKAVIGFVQARIATRRRLAKYCTGEESDNQDFQQTISVHFCSGLEWRLARVAEISGDANRTGIAGGKIGFTPDSQ